VTRKREKSCTIYTYGVGLWESRYETTPIYSVFYNRVNGAPVYILRCYAVRRESENVFKFGSRLPREKRR
jgi:hypothetical protein